MKLARFMDHSQASLPACLGLVIGECVVDVRSASDLATEGVAQLNLNDADTFANLDTGTLQRVQSALISGGLAGVSDHHIRRIGEVKLLAPFMPASFRDFFAFEEHVRNARRRRGLEVPEAWYDAPAFYFSNTASILGPGESVRFPASSLEWDFELEIAAVIGKAGSDIPVDQADDYIAGFTILNDWSARDIQRREVSVGLGPAKAKDFATSIGPYLVTPDELSGHMERTERGAVYDLVMTATINEEEISRGNARDMHWTFADLIAQASRDTRLIPGDMIGSGTVGTGCLLELPEGVRPWLQSGDRVSLEIEILGVLSQTVS